VRADLWRERAGHRRLARQGRFWLGTSVLQRVDAKYIAFLRAKNSTASFSDVSNTAAIADARLVC